MEINNFFFFPRCHSLGLCHNNKPKHSGCSSMPFLLLIMMLPWIVDVVGVKVSKPNFHRDKDKNFLWEKTDKVKILMDLWLLSKSNVSPLTFNSNKKSNVRNFFILDFQLLKGLHLNWKERSSFLFSSSSSGMLFPSRLLFPFVLSLSSWLVSPAFH